MPDDKKPADNPKPPTDAKPDGTPADKPAEKPAGTPPPADTSKAAPVDAKPDGTTPAQAAGSTAPDTYDLTVPENGPFTSTDLDAFKANAKKFGLTNAAAQQVLDARVAELTSARDQYIADAKADKEIGGAHYEQSLEQARRGRNVMFPPGTAGATFIAELLDQTGLFNHPELVRAFARIGKGAREDKPVDGARASSDAGEKPSRAKILYGVE